MAMRSEVALVRLVKAHDAFHERALACAVFADERVETSRPEL